MEVRRKILLDDVGWLLVSCLGVGSVGGCAGCECACGSVVGSCCCCRLLVPGGFWLSSVMVAVGQSCW